MEAAEGISEVGFGEHRPLEHPKLVGADGFSASLVCSLGVHEEAFSKEDALLDISLFPEGAVNIGDHIRIVTYETASPLHGNQRYKSGQQHATHNQRSSGSSKYADIHAL